MGGLFPSWILFHQPQLYQRYVIVSPSWLWNNYEVCDGKRNMQFRMMICPLQYLRLLADWKRQKNIERLFLRIASGKVKHALEHTLERSDRLVWIPGAELIPDFRQRLISRHYPNLKLTALPFAEETNESIPGGGFSRGLRSVFGNWSSTDSPTSPVPAYALSSPNRICS